MQAHIDDEPVTIQSMLERLLDLDGQPSFTIAVPNIGRTLREVLDNDMEAQRKHDRRSTWRPKQRGQHTTPPLAVLLESILAEEEKHLSWLQTEIDLLERLREPLYVANRLTAAPTPTAG